MKTIKYFDMFAGIGGFRSGLARTGDIRNVGDFFMPVGWCEIDKYAQKAYRALYETEGEYFCDDARTICTDELPDIDLICGGFPCQPFSVSGRRLGLADTRGTLFHEYRQTVAERQLCGMKSGDLLIFCSKTCRGYGTNACVSAYHRRRENIRSYPLRDS